MDSSRSRSEARMRIGRRELLGGTLGAVAFSIVRPTAVRGSAASSKVELGVVGLGGRGSWIAKLFAQHGGFHLSAVADYFPQVARQRGAALGVDKKRCFSGLLGYRRMIDAKVDAVALETPPWVFPEHAAAAVAAGCHVYVAKPIACDVPGCLSIGESGKKATRKKLAFVVDFQVRTDPFWQEAVRRVRQGALEKVAMICSHYTDDGFSDPPKAKTIVGRLRGLVWVNDVDLGGSYIANCDIHALDAALWIGGDKPPTAAVGASRRLRKDPHGDSADTYSVTFEFADGHVVSHRGEHIRNVSGFTCGCVAYGWNAYMEGNYNGQTLLRGGKLRYPGGEVKNLYAEGAKRNIDLFHKNITGGHCANETIAPSVNSTLTTILGREAAKQPGRLTWDELIKTNRRLEVDTTGLVQ